MFLLLVVEVGGGDGGGGMHGSFTHILTGQQFDYANRLRVCLFCCCFFYVVALFTLPVFSVRPFLFLLDLPPSC